MVGCPRVVAITGNMPMGNSARAGGPGGALLPSACRLRV